MCVTVTNLFSLSELPLFLTQTVSDEEHPLLRSRTEIFFTVECIFLPGKYSNQTDPRTLFKYIKKLPLISERENRRKRKIKVFGDIKLFRVG